MAGLEFFDTKQSVMWVGKNTIWVGKYSQRVDRHSSKKQWGRARVVKYITMGLERRKKGWWSLSLLGSWSVFLSAASLLARLRDQANLFLATTPWWRQTKVKNLTLFFFRVFNASHFQFHFEYRAYILFWGGIGGKMCTVENFVIHPQNLPLLLF